MQTLISLAPQEESKNRVNSFLTNMKDDKLNKKARKKFCLNSQNNIALEMRLSVWYFSGFSMRELYKDLNYFEVI